MTDDDGDRLSPAETTTEGETERRKSDRQDRLHTVVSVIAIGAGVGYAIPGDQVWHEGGGHIVIGLLVAVGGAFWLAFVLNRRPTEEPDSARAKRLTATFGLLALLYALPLLFLAALVDGGGGSALDLLTDPITLIWRIGILSLPSLIYLPFAHRSASSGTPSTRLFVVFGRILVLELFIPLALAVIGFVLFLVMPHGPGA